MGFFDDIGKTFTSIPKRTMGGVIGAGIGSGLIQPPVQGFAKGSKNVKKTGIYKLHKGEIVVPAKQSNMIRKRLKKKGNKKKMDKKK